MRTGESGTQLCDIDVPAVGEGHRGREGAKDTPVFESRKGPEDREKVREGKGRPRECIDSRQCSKLVVLQAARRRRGAGKESRVSIIVVVVEVGLLLHLSALAVAETGVCEFSPGISSKLAHCRRRLRLTLLSDTPPFGFVPGRNFNQPPTSPFEQLKTGTWNPSERETCAQLNDIRGWHFWLADEDDESPDCSS